MGVKDLEDLKKLSMIRSQIDGITVAEIMIDEFPTVSSDDRVADALSKMRDTKYQEIPVVDEGVYVGMISYGSILKKKSLTLDTKVKGLISNLPTLSTEVEATRIAELMVTNNCRQLPVVNGKKIVGIVSRRGMTGIAAKIKALSDIKVWEIMTTPVESVGRNDMLNDALGIMRRLDIRTVPIVDERDSVVGIVGMKEIIDNHWKTDDKVLGEYDKGMKSQIAIESVCVTAVKTVEWEDDMEVAAKLMEKYGISTLPVVDEGELVGILTEYDIVELLSACRERDVLYVQISGLDENDKTYAEAMYADIGEELTKISKIYKPESLTIHVAKYNAEGDRAKYSLTGKLFINGKTVNCKEVGWDIIQTNNDLIKKIGIQVKDMKDSTVTFKRRRK